VYIAIFLVYNLVICSLGSFRLHSFSLIVPPLDDDGIEMTEEDEDLASRYSTLGEEDEDLASRYSAW